MIMSEKFTLVGADAEMWEACGITTEEEHALVLALWNWYRGRPDESELTVAAKSVYRIFVSRWERKVEVRKRRAQRTATSKTAGAEKHTPTADEQTAAAQNGAPAAEIGTPDVSPGIPEKPTRFVPPTVEEVEAFCSQNNLSTIQASEFVDYYTANGWKVGRTPMRNWQAIVRNWDRRAQQQKDEKKSKNELIGLELRNPSMREEDYVL